jgi:hypothetical protein
VSASHLCQSAEFARIVARANSLPPLPNPDLPGQRAGALQIEDRSEAAKKIREELFGNYTKEQLNAAALVTS